MAKATCSATSCNEPVLCKGFCKFHYERSRRGRDVNAPRRWYGVGVDADGRRCAWCEEYKPWSEFARGAATNGRLSRCRLCRSIRPTCTYPTCVLPAAKAGLCYAHDKRRRLGLPMDAPIRRKARNGAGHTDSNGYRLVTPTKGARAQLEHRIKMEELLGRKLVSPENVHHINGDKGDNTTDGPLVNFRSGNLELWSKSQPSGQSVADKVAWAKAMLALYEPEALA